MGLWIHLRTTIMRSETLKFWNFRVTSNGVISATTEVLILIQSALESPWTRLYRKNNKKLLCLKPFTIWLHLRKYEAMGPPRHICLSSKMAILPQTLVKSVVNEEESWKCFSNKVVQDLFKTVSIVFLRPMVAEIAIVVTEVVNLLTTKVHHTVVIRCDLRCVKSRAEQARGTEPFADDIGVP